MKLLKHILLKIKDIFVSPACCRPHKHTPGCHASNRTGENNGKSILKSEDVLEIRRLYKTGGTSYSALSSRFSISRTTIGDIVRHRTWRHL